jgi:hypothetical protein
VDAGCRDALKKKSVGAGGCGLKRSGPGRAEDRGADLGSLAEIGAKRVVASGLDGPEARCVWPLQGADIYLKERHF